MTEAPDKQGKDQKDVLAAKDNVTKSNIGLQQWGDESIGEGIGTAGSGTAERAAHIAEGQRKATKESLDEEREH